MTTKELDSKLSQALADFSSEMAMQYSDYSKDPAVGGDIAQVSRQTFYLLDEFRKQIIMFLESK